MLSRDFIQGFLEGAKRQGHDIHSILKAADIDPVAIDDPNAQFDGKQLQRLFNALMHQLDDIFLGFVKERHKPVLNLATLKMAMDADTLGESIRARTEFRESLRDDVHYEFRVNKKQHEFSLTVDDFEMLEGVDPHLFYWLRLSTLYRYHSWLIGRRIKLNRVHFSMPAPLGSQTHLSLFNCDCVFNQAQNAVFFDDSYLSYPVIRTEAEIMASNVTLEHHPDWFEVPGSDLSLTRQVEQTIEALHQDGFFHPKLEVVAKQLRINQRRLTTQLSREQTNFQQIKTQVRKTLAIKKLLATAQPIATVASDLGFSEPGDFTRNFKRWTGLSPSEYRAQHGNQ